MRGKPTTFGMVDSEMYLLRY